MVNNSGCWTAGLQPVSNFPLHVRRHISVAPGATSGELWIHRTGLDDPIDPGPARQMTAWNRLGQVNTHLHSHKFQDFQKQAKETWTANVEQLFLFQVPSKLYFKNAEIYFKFSNGKLYLTEA